ncbi:di-heme-cytochrome C peroxidase [Endozoicomonas arenosclerae]|uniref:di-heme-cytochrome C peroxidase n=1 Tax=Endozoicomonas arenosclerae TaxID=1633495 RepID=UPI0007862DC3|nr:di-heme-cytochrome C peroxidase [Endozoicomonas arenosclerae]
MALQLVTRLFKAAGDLISRNRQAIKFICLGFALSITITFISGKVYQSWDDDPQRGAVGIENGEFNESYSTPIYLDQGWSASDSLWYYNTTQGSALLPYDFFLTLEQKDSETPVRDNMNMDKYRYLPQKPTFFNPDGLAVGFVKETYQGKDYMGYTCAACHTAQVNYKGAGIRIDGGPAMVDMVGFLTSLEGSMKQTLSDNDKRDRFIKNVLALKNDYKNEEQIIADLEKWTETTQLYNTINHSKVKYGHARLDAFGRIYNRVLQYVLSKNNVEDALVSVTSPSGRHILNQAEVDKVLEGVNKTILGNDDFSLILERLMSKEPGYPGLSIKETLYVRNALFNEPDAPVSYPFLWDIAQSDYVQWNGLAGNSGLGPLGRNTGEVIGVFGILDWTASDQGFSLSSWLTGQDHKRKHIDFKSSIDLVNLQRLEVHLKSLQSPVWPEEVLGEIDQKKAARGQRIYAQYCQSCHEVIDRSNLDRRVVAQMSGLEHIGTDPAMAENSVQYKGKSGNFEHTYQDVDVGTVLITETAPVVQTLTSATKGVVATPDADKWWIRRIADWFYTVGLSFFNNDIKASVKNGNYDPDTTANPYNSLLAYKARPLNGIWATAPYLHNGSVPTLYDLLLPAKRDGDPEEGVYRPDTFMVGSREFDPVRVGFRSEGYDGTRFITQGRGNLNTGHEYAAGKTAQMDGTVLPALNDQERWDLIEYIKTL